MWDLPHAFPPPFKSKHMKLLVTGATGLLGSNLLRELDKRGYQIRVMVLAGDITDTIATLNIERVTGNILNFSEFLAAAKGVEAIIHMAADTSVWPSRNERTIQINVEGTKNALHVAASIGVKRFIHVGTANTFGFGNQHELGQEDTPYKCHKYKLDYMDSKYVAHQLVMDAVREGLPALVVNPTFMLGPYDAKPSSGQMLLALAEGKILGYTRGGKNYICAKDAAVGIANALTKGKIGESYILGNENLSYKEAFYKMATVMKVNVPGFRLPSWLVLLGSLLNCGWSKIQGKKPAISFPLARISCEEHYYASRKAVLELELPQTPIEEGIRECFEWMMINGISTRNES